MKLKMTVISLLTAFSLVACSGESANEESSPKKVETDHIKELVSDYSVGRMQSESASITSEQLIVTENNGSKLVYDLPEDEFFVSIAPYVNETHP